MTTVVGALQWAVALAFGLLGILSLLSWRRLRDRPSMWLAVTFVSLAVVNLLSRLLSAFPALPGVAGRAEVVLFLLSGASLLLFQHSYLPLRPLTLRVTLGLVAVVALAAMLADLPAGESSSVSAGSSTQLTLGLAVVIAWAVCVVEPAYRFWVEGQRLALVQRARLHALSLSIVGVAVILVLSVVSSVLEPATDPVVATGAQIAALMIIPLLYAAVAPPRWLRRAWREREEGHFRRAVEVLVGDASDAEALARESIEWSVRLVGAQAATLIHADGTILAVVGIDEQVARLRAAATEPPATAVLERTPTGVTLTVPVPFSSGVGMLIVDGGVFTPFFGSDEVDRMRQYVASLAPAVDRIRLVQALRRSESDLRQAMQTRTDFMNAIVHDMRSPLTVSSGYLEMLDQGNFGALPDSAERPVATVLAKLAEMRKLVDDLLLTARVESGTLPVNTGIVDLREIVISAVERARPAAELRGGRLETNVPSEPVLALADHDLLDRILDNLVNNALSYGGDTPQVTVTVPADPGRPGVEVADRGPGIPHDMRDHIFERFARGRRTGGGAGLGLYISRQLALRQGGSLALEGNGGGARFLVRLRAPEPDAARQVA
ncbi:MAG: sensor histidine kinase [Candidatus Dormibacteria bacterium]